MSLLTLAAIADDPWNAVDYDLPANADRALLELAFGAASYCVDQEYRLMEAARAGASTSSGWLPEDNIPDVLANNVGRLRAAEQRMEQIAIRLGGPP